MKRKEMNSLAHSLCAYLLSRNNDIRGYWGIGILCRIAKQEKRSRFSFKVYPGELIRIYGREINGSTEITDKLAKFQLDSIEGRVSFFKDEKYPDSSNRYICGISISVTQDGRTGIHLCHVSCWAHDPNSERKSNREPSSKDLETKQTSLKDLLIKAKQVFHLRKK